MRAGDAELRPSGTRVLLLDDFVARRRPLGQVPDPDRARVLPRARARAGRRRAVSEPGRCDRERAAPRRLGRARGGEPGAGRARGRGRGADRRPHERAAAPRDRADRPLLRARGHDQVALGGHLRRARDRRRRGRVLRARWSGRARELRARSRGPARRRRHAGDDHARVRRARRRGRRGRGRADAALPAGRLRALAARDLHDRADGADQRRAGSARSRCGHARAPRRPLRRARALAGDDAPVPLGAGHDARADVHGRGDVHAARADARSTSRSRRRATSRASRTATCRSRSTSAARS